MNKKQELRQNCLAKRYGFGEDFIKRASVDACRLLSQTDAYKRANTVLLYYPIKNELSALPLTELLQTAGKKIGFPVCNVEKKSLIFKEISNISDLECGSYGIFEPRESCQQIFPDENTLCIVPAAALSRKGERMGYGAGYYDRFLSDFSGTSVGFTYSELLFDTLPNEAHDIPLDMIITEREVLCIERKA